MTAGGEAAAGARSGARPGARPGFPRWLPWLTWGLGATLFFYGFFQRIAPSVMIDSLMRDFAASGAVLGNLSAVYFYAYATLQIPVGLMLDRWGARRMLTGSALLCAAGSLAFGLADTLALAYLGRFMIGAGAAFAFVGSLTLASAWFPANRFAQFAGMTMMAGMVGGFAAQAPLAAAVELTGWRAVLIAAAVLGAALTAAIWTVVRDAPPDAPVRPHGERQSLGQLLRGLLEVLAKRQNWMIALCGAAMSAPMLSFAGLWGVAWLVQAHGLSRPEAAGTTSLLLIGWAVGSPIAGGISDRLDAPKRTLQAGMVLGLACFGGLLYVPSLPPPVLWLLFFLAGCGLGSMVVCYALIRQANRPQVSGASLGFSNAMTVGAGAVFQPLVGYLLDLRWQGEMLEGARVYSAEAYAFAFSVLVGYLALCLVMSFFIRQHPRSDPAP